MIKYIKTMLILLVVLVLPTSCIKEDLEECDNVTIYFQYLADGDKDVLYQYMSKIDLYVFDETGRAIGVGHYTQDELTNFKAVPSFKLKPGARYKVVALGNAYENTEVVNLESATSFDDIFIQSPGWESGDNITNHDHNYLGQKEFIMPVQEGVMYRDTVTLYSSHINVDIEITGLPAPSQRADGLPVTVRIENSNAQTSFNNEINIDEKGTCYPELIYDAERGCYRTDNFALFRMDDGGAFSKESCEHELVLSTSDGEERLRGSLYNFVINNRDYIDVTKQEAYLPIQINFIQTNVEIKLPAWYIEDITPDWN